MKSITSRDNPLYKRLKTLAGSTAHQRRSGHALLEGLHLASAYLDAAALIAIAREQGCDAVHPGYGFLSERADFAQACADAGLRFIGPTPEQLSLFGDKARARALAEQCGVPVMPGSAGAVTPGTAATRPHPGHAASTPAWSSRTCNSLPHSQRY